MGVVDVLSATGSFEAQFGEGLEPSGVAVDEASGNVFVSSGAAVLVFKPNGSGHYSLLSEWSGFGTPGKEFGELGGVAVDNSTSASDPSAGDVYVVDGVNSVVDVLRPKPAGSEEALEGSFVRVLKGAKLEQPNGVTVSSTTGRVYVADSSSGVVDIYNAAGSSEGKLSGAGSPNGTFRGPSGEEGNVTAVAVDEASGDVYVAEAERHVVSQFTAAGVWTGWITTAGGGPLGEPRGVALAPTGNVYVADAQLERLDMFGPGVVVPDAKTSAASKVTKTAAVLNGEVNGDGKPAKYHFQWGTTEAYGSETPVQAAGSAQETAASALGGLQAGTTYFFRLVVENENGVNYGAGRELTTVAAVEGLSTGPVESLKPTSVTLTGSVSPNGTDAHYLFDWGTTTAYGDQTPSVDAGSGKEPVAAKAELGGLTPNTTYHYRLVGSDSFGTTTGEDAKFRTSGPPAITSEPTTGIGHETATINAEINPGELETAYHLEYGETTDYGTEVPVGGAKLPAGEAPDPVSAVLSGLKLGVTYHYRVIASNQAGETIGPDQTFTAIPPALIESESAAEVSTTGATLQTQINPLGHDTTYYFQYGSQPCQPSPVKCINVPLPPGADIGSSETGQSGSVRVQELTPDTTYHYRVLAANTLGTAEGPEHTLATQAAATPFALADNRAWELVTPPDKHGAPVEALTREGGLILASEAGSALAYVADGAVTEEPQGNRSPEMQQVIATRAAGAWVSTDIATPSSAAKGVSPGAAPEYQFFTPDLSFALVEPAGVGPEPPLAPGVTQKTMYVRDDAARTYLPAVTDANVAPGTVFQDQIHFVTATPDLGHIVLQSATALLGPGSGPGVYEWAAGHLALVSILPGGTPAPQAEVGYYHVAAHALSRDGSRIIWTASEENSHRGHLYMRDTTKGETIQLDAAQGVPEPGGVGVAQFQTASGDGSRVFFTDKQQLTKDSTAEPGQGAGRSDLYECELGEESGKQVCHLRDLTVDHNTGEHAAVQNFVFGSGEDGATVYFVAQGALAGNANGNRETAEANGNNLYELHYDGLQWTPRFIAELSGEDKAEWEGEQHANTAYLTARVSPSGRYLAFMTAASPTGYDNTDQNSGRRDEEVYLYDSTAASLTCVSCNPTGARPVGVLDTEEVGEGLGLLVDRRKIWVGHGLAGNIPGWTAQSLTTALFQSRYLSDEGRLFFNSPDHLVPQASNGKENVYEYEPSGLGSCESSSGGCVSLISSGSSGKESAFLEATPSGNDVFFLTAARLLRQDTDTAFDIYDARVCTPRSPCLTPPAPALPGCSTADACRPASPPQQAQLGLSGSATVSGSGSIPRPPQQAVKGARVARPRTRAQKLASALKACKKQHRRRKRLACEAHARKLYGAHTSAKARRDSTRSSPRGASR